MKWLFCTAVFLCLFAAAMPYVRRAFPLPSDVCQPSNPATDAPDTSERSFLPTKNLKEDYERKIELWMELHAKNDYSNGLLLHQAHQEMRKHYVGSEQQKVDQWFANNETRAQEIADPNNPFRKRR